MRGDTLLARQNALIFAASGMSAAGAAAYEARMAALLGRLVAVPAGEPVPDALRAALVGGFRDAAAAMSAEDRAAFGPADSAAFDALLEGMVGGLAAPWLRAFLAYDPQPALRALDVPALAVFGENDLQVPPAQNAAPMRAALDASDSPAWDVVVMDDLNHLLQTSETGSPAEYVRIGETMSPAVLARVAEWILDDAAGE